MPSKDQILPGVNDWMPSDVLARLNATENPDSTPGTSRTAKNAAVVQGLAARLGRSAEAVAGSIPEDTLRRCKYPVVPVPQPDGSVRYDRDVVERGGKRDVVPNLGKDFSPERGGERPDAPARDARGRYTK
jgi:hypothetical protein